MQAAPHFQDIVARVRLLRDRQRSSRDCLPSGGSTGYRMLLERGVLPHEPVEPHETRPPRFDEWPADHVLWNATQSVSMAPAVSDCPDGSWPRDVLTVTPEAAGSSPVDPANYLSPSRTSAAVDAHHSHEVLRASTPARSSAEPSKPECDAQADPKHGHDGFHPAA
jgi:hypothetical protein